MAVTTAQNFVIKINVKNAASGDLNKLAGDSAAVAAQTSSLEKQIALLTEALKNANGSVMNLSNGYTAAQASASALAGAAAQAQPQLQQNVTVMERIGVAVKTTTHFVQGSIATFSHMVQIIQILSNKQNLERISHLMSVLALVAKVKGHGELSKELEIGADKVLLLSKGVEEFKAKSEEAFPAIADKVDTLNGAFDALKAGVADNFEGLADKSKRTLTAFHILEGAAKSVGVALAGAAGLRVASKLFPELGQKIYEAQGKVSSFGGAFTKATEIVEKGLAVRSFVTETETLAGSIHNVGQTMIDLATDTEGTTATVKLAQTVFKGVADVTGKVSDVSGMAAVGVLRMQKAFNNAAPIVGQFGTLGKTINSGFELTAGFLARFSDRLGLMSGATLRASESFKTIQEDFPIFAKVLETSGKFVQSFSTIIGGIGKDLGNIPAIFKALVAEVPPLVGRFGQAIGTITAMSGALFGLGTLLLKSDSTMGKVAGGSMIALAVATGGILVAVKALTAAMGDFVVGAGMKLFTLFDHGIEAAIADEHATALFERTVVRLSSSTEEGVKHVESWRKTIQAIAGTAKFAGSEAETLAAQVARMGQEFNLTQTQQENLAKAISVFALNGEEATQVADAIRMSFLGTGKQAEELGLHVNDLAVNNGDYARSINKVAGNMSKQEIVTAKLGLVLAQAATTTELLSGRGESLAQVQEKIKVASGELDAQFAQGSIPIYKTLNDLQLRVLLTLESMPQGFKNAISATTAYAGSLLIVVGTIMKWAFIVAGTIGGITALNAVISTSATLQAILTTAFTITNGAMGAQVVAVTGLTTVFENLALLIKGSLIGALRALGAAFITIGRSVLTFTATLLTNPLFIAAAVIATGIFLVVRAVQELRAQVDFLKPGMDGVGKATGKAAETASIFKVAWEGVSAVLEGVVRVATSLTKIIVSGLIADIVALQMVYYKLRAAVSSSTEDQKKWQKEIATSKDYMAQLKQAMKGATVEIISAFDGTAKAAEKTADKIKGVDAAIQNFRRSISLVKSDPIQDAYLKTSVLGDTFEKAKADYEAANFAFAKAFDTLNSSQDQSKESIDNVNKAREEAAKAYLNMLKTQLDAVKDFKKQENEGNIQALKDSDQLVKAAQLEGDIRSKEFEKNVKSLQTQIGLTKEQIKVVDAARKSIEDRNKADVTKAAIEEAQKVAEKSKKLAEEVAKSQEEPLKKYQEQIDKFKALAEAEKYQGMTAMQAADAEYEASVKNIDLIEAQLKATQALFPERQKQINQLREMIELQKKNAKESAPAQVGDLGDILSPLADAAKGAKDTFKDLGHGIVDGFQAAWAAVSGDDAGSFTDLVKEGLADAGQGLMKAGGSIIQSMQKGAATLITAIKQITLADIGDAIVDGAKAAGEILVDVFSGALVDDFTAVISAIGNLPTTLMQAFQHLDQALTNAIKQLPKALENFIQKLPEVLKHIIDAIPKFVQAIVKAIPQIIKAIVDAAPAFTKALMDALPSLIDAVVDGIVKLIDMVPEILRKVLEGLPKIILSVFNGIGKIIGAIVRAIPQIIRAIVDNLPQIIEAIIQGILDAVGEIAQAFIQAMIDNGLDDKMGMAILKMIPKLVAGIVQGVGKGLYDIWKKLWGSISGIKAPKGLADLPGKIADGASKLGKQIAKDASKIFAVKDLENAAGVAGKVGKGDIPGAIAAAAAAAKSGLEKFLEKLKGAWLWVKEHIWEPFWNGLKNIFKGIGAALKELWDNIYTHVIEPLVTLHKKAFKWIYDNVVEPIVNLHKRAFKWIYDNIVEPLKTIGQKAFQWVNDHIVQPLATVGQGAYQWVADNIVTPLATMGQKGFQWVMDNIITPLKTVVSDAWQPIKDFFGNLFKGKISEAFSAAFQPISDFFSGKDGFMAKVTNAFKPIMNLFSDAKDGIASFVGKAFKPITDLFSDAKNGVMDVVGKAFKPITDLFAGGKGGFMDKIAEAFKPITDLFAGGSFSDRMKQAGKDIWEGIKGSFEKGIDTIKGVGGSIWEGLKTALGKVGTVFSDLGKGIWEGLKTAGGNVGTFFSDFGKGIWNGLKDALGGLGSFFKGIFDKLDPMNLFSKIFNLPPQPDPGKVEGILGINVPFVTFAEGGMVPGAALTPGDSLMNDRILAMLSPGEAIIPRSKMSDPNVRGIVDQIMNGSLKLPTFYYGEDKVKKVQGAAAKIGIPLPPLPSLPPLPTPSNPLPLPPMPEIPSPADLWKIVKEKAYDAIGKIFEANKFAEGGWVQGTGSGDHVAALLTPGEFVMNRRSAQQNASFLTSINNGGNASGGAGGGVHVTIQKVEINSTAPISPETIKRDIVPTLMDEIKKKSRHGVAVISAPGVRST